MAKYEVEHSCGHVVTHQLFGKNVERDRKIAWMETVPCTECKIKEDLEAQAAANKEAALANAESGLLALSGSEKQIAWAEAIRKDMVARMDAGKERINEIQDKVLANPENYQNAFDEMLKKGFLSIEEYFSCSVLAIERLKNETSASWWIEHRGNVIGMLIDTTAIQCRTAKFDTTKEAEEAKAESTIRPESPLTETVAEIRIKEKSIEVFFQERREDFWHIIKKQLRFTWQDTRWVREITVRTGTAIDRAAEVGNNLLRAGFVVRCFDDRARAMMVDASFVPECGKWLTALVSSEYAGWFALAWRREDGDFFAEAKRLPGARYSKPYVVVKAEHFNEVLDFAEVNGFMVSPGARKLADQAKAERDASLVATAITPKKQAPTSTDRPELEPDQAGGVHADLLDD